MAKAFRSLFSEDKPVEEVPRNSHKRTLTVGVLQSSARKIKLSGTSSHSREIELGENANPIYKSVSFRSQKKFKWSEVLPVKKVDENEISVYKAVFQDIINQNKVYGPLLSTVRDKYESFFDSEVNIKCENLERENSVLKDKEKLKRERLVNDIKKSRVRESQYIELMRLLKADGAPIDELYLKFIGSPAP